MQPIMKPVHVSQTVDGSGQPRAMATALFLHRVKQALKPPTSVAKNLEGHPILHVPIVVKPRRTVVSQPRPY